MIRKTNKKLVKVYRVLDFAMALFIVTPLTVGSFRGLWALEDSLVYPENSYYSTATSFLLGPCFILLVTLGQDLFEPLVRIPRFEPVFHFASKIYNILWVSAYINQWRAIWYIYEIFIGDSFGSSLRAFVISTFFLFIFRVFATVCTCPPFLLAEDFKEVTFVCQTRFKCKLDDSPVKFLADACFSVLILQSAMIIFWKASFLVIDVVLSGLNDKYIEANWAVFAGVTASIVAYLLTDIVQKLGAKLHSLPKIIFQNVWLLYLAVTATVTWYGIWAIMDLNISTEPIYSLFSLTISLYLLTTFFSLGHIFQKSILIDTDYTERGSITMLIIGFTEDMYKRNTVNYSSLNVKPLLLNPPLEKKNVELNTISIPLVNGKKPVFPSTKFLQSEV